MNRETINHSPDHIIRRIFVHRYDRLSGRLIQGLLDIECGEAMYNGGIKERLGHDISWADPPSKTKDDFPRIMLDVFAWGFYESSRIEHQRIRVQGRILRHTPIDENFKSVRKLA